MLDHCLQLWPNINLAFGKRIFKKIVKDKSKVEVFFRNIHKSCVHATSQSIKFKYCYLYW